MTEPAVRVDAVTKSFGDVHAVRGISFEVPRGSVLGILGPNGAGKTTLVDILCTLITPDSGSATVAGQDVVRNPGGVREAISMTGQYAALDETLGGRDNLIFFGRMQGLRRGAARERADHLLEQFDLAEFGKRPVFSYSGGMRRRLDIACGLVIRPEVVFLDEPTTGLDPRSRQAVWALVEALKADGITTLLTTQYLEEADRLSDNIIVLDKGRVVAEGTAEQLKQKVGGAYCEVVLDDPSRSDEMCGLLRTRLGVDPRQTVGDDTTITLPTTDGVETMGAVIAIAKDAGIRLTDVGLRNPSLDDVFLTLTGSPSGTTEDAPR
ncbi:ATP-binding cassette domain-containing protein [Gordonia rubripertincta]|uniref:ATP-binding cassette domain-containing protein n=1 Tax=Gordonia rubripertincta TaxID=36822 RepID=UPI0015F946C8|nr:ATP-binding cassette domain-containing protein [Gordonia rubripertincta]QMU21816.1 ATP-binding cassette domain-containing protein [Gordonia rubripertincta]